MPDNTAITPGAGVSIATRAVTYSGDAVQVQAVGLVTFAGADDAKTVADIPAGEGAAATALRVDLATDGTVIGIVTEAAPGTDTASSGLNGRLQRIAQRLTSLIALLPTALGAGGGLKIEGVGVGGTPAAGVMTVQDTNGTSTAFSTAADIPYTIGRSQPGVGTGANASAQYIWDGAQLSAVRGNLEATLLASAARTATTSSADQTNFNGRGALITIDVTAITATPSLVVTVEAKDVLSGKYVTLLTSAAITAISTVQLAVYPGVTAAANLAVSMILPRSWRVTVTAADADSATYSVGASVIL